MKLSQRIFRNPILPVLTAWIVVLVAASLWPGTTSGNNVAMLVIIFLSVFTARQVFPRSIGAMTVIAVASAALSVGVILNTWGYTTAACCTPDNPYLVNSDSNRWWQAAIHFLDPAEGAAAHPSHGLYGYMLGCIMWVFGKNVGVALITSMFFIMVSLVLTGVLTRRITRNDRVAVVAMACTASVCYWLTMGTLILKDAFVIMSLLIGAVSLTYSEKRFLLLISFAAILLFAVRPGAILFLVPGILLLKFRKNHRVWPVCAVVICIAIWILPDLLGLTEGFEKTVMADVSANEAYNSPNQLALYRIIGNYDSTLKKILLLPLTAVVQFFIPFPWNFSRDIPFGMTEAYAHVAYPWYLFGLIFLYYLVTQRHTFREPLYLFSLWAILIWLIPCYLFAGMVSRYGLPMVALMAPAVAVTLMRNLKARRFYIFLVFGCVLVSGILILAYNLQILAMQ